MYMEIKVFCSWDSLIHVKQGAMVITLNWASHLLHKLYFIFKYNKTTIHILLIIKLFTDRLSGLVFIFFSRKIFKICSITWNIMNCN